MGNFHVVIRAQDADRSAGLAISFEDLAATLESFDRLYLEPDGSFVWRGESGGGPWQVDGLVYDRAGRVQYLDLKGTASYDVVPFLVAAVDQFLDALGTPLAGLAFDDVRTGSSQNYEGFRRDLIADGDQHTGP